MVFWHQRNLFFYFLEGLSCPLNYDFRKCLFSVWNFATGKCRRTFRHRHVVQTVDVSYWTILFFQFKRVLFVLSTTTMDFFIFTFVHKITFRETSPTHWFKYFSLLFQVSDLLVVSGCEGGKVKVWDIERACLLKVRTFFLNILRFIVLHSSGASCE